MVRQEKVENDYGNSNDITERKSCLGLGEVACWQKGIWEQISIQDKNWSRWVCTEIKGKAGCTRIHSTVWNRL